MISFSIILLFISTALISLLKRNQAAIVKIYFILKRAKDDF
jgi:hypothetical protein